MTTPIQPDWIAADWGTSNLRVWAMSADGSVLAEASSDQGMGKLAKELGGLRGRLNNPKFVASAPEEVVAEAKANLALRENEETQLKAAIARLKELG